MHNEESRNRRIRLNIIYSRMHVTCLMHWWFMWELLMHAKCMMFCVNEISFHICSCFICTNARSHVLYGFCIELGRVLRDSFILFTMDQSRSQGSIQMLLSAEHEAQQIVAAARNRNHFTSNNICMILWFFWVSNLCRFSETDAAEASKGRSR